MSGHAALLRLLLLRHEQAPVREIAEDMTAGDAVDLPVESDEEQRGTMRGIEPLLMFGLEKDGPNRFGKILADHHARCENLRIHRAASNHAAHPSIPGPRHSFRCAYVLKNACACCNANENLPMGYPE